MSKRKRLCILWVLVLTIPLVAKGSIQIVEEEQGWLGSNKSQVTTSHNGSTEIIFDATGLDKLVVAIGTESGFNNRQVTDIGVMFGEVPMTLAVSQNTWTNQSYDCGIAAIFYLDDPPPIATTFSVSVSTTGGGPNGGLVSIIGLTGADAGVGNTNGTSHTQDSAGEVSTTLTTAHDNALVIAAVQNSGRNNAAGTPTAVEPLNLIHNGFWGSQWGSVASAYQYVPARDTVIAPTFNTNAAGNIHVIATEFLPLPPSATVIVIL